MYPYVGETPTKHLPLDLAGWLLPKFAALSAVPS